MGVKRIVASCALAMGIGVLWAGAPLAGASEAAAEAKSKKDDSSRRICKNVTPTASRLTTRVCRTRAAWDASRDKTQDGVLQHQMKQSTGYEKP